MSFKAIIVIYLEVIQQVKNRRWADIKSSVIHDVKYASWGIGYRLPLRPPHHVTLLGAARAQWLITSAPHAWITPPPPPRLPLHQHLCHSQTRPRPNPDSTQTAFKSPPSPPRGGGNGGRDAAAYQGQRCCSPAGNSGGQTWLSGSDGWCDRSSTRSGSSWPPSLGRRSPVDTHGNMECKPPALFMLAWCP